MKVINNKVVVSGLAIVLMSMVGCAGIDSAARKEFNDNKIEGVIYGFVTDFKTAPISELCDLIKNKDARCLEKDKYKVVRVISNVGFASGLMGTVALAPKNMDVGAFCRSEGAANCTYVKASVDKNKLGTVLEVASRPGENKCYWSGFRGNGGTVCNTFSWDYRKDGRAAIVQ